MVIALAALVGLLIGSFLTVVVDRVPRRASVVRPGSACSACGAQLTPVDLVPVLSWLALRGRCRRCSARIGWEPPIIELATAGVFAAFAARFGWGWLLLAHCVLGAALVAQTAIDLRTRRLPREVTYTALALGAPLLAVAALAESEPQRIWMTIGGAIIATVIMGVVNLAARGGMGEGDVRFAPLVGAYLGWQNPGIVPLGLFLGFLGGAAAGVVVMVVVSSAGRKTAIPFGPFLALGAFVAVFIGQDMVDLVLAR